jgi:hypothetical protein
MHCILKKTSIFVGLNNLFCFTLFNNTTMKKILFLIVCLVFSTFSVKAQNAVLIKDLTPGSASSFFDLEDDIIGHIGDKVLFTVYDASSIGHLYVSDGTDAGTVELHHLITSDESYTTFLKIDAATIAFVVYNESTIKSNLFVTDGNTVTVLNKHSEDLSVDNLHTYGGQLFYTSDNRTLHRIDVANTADIVLYTAPRPFVDYYFDGVQNVYYALKGAQGDTLFVRNVISNVNTKLGFIGNSTEYNLNFQLVAGKLVFFIEMEDYTYGFYTTDGTAVGTQLLKTFAWGGSNQKKYFTIQNGQLFFEAALPISDPDFDGFQLWVTDGTVSGTAALSNINIPFAFVGYSAVYNNKLYFPSVLNGTIDTYLHVFNTDGSVANTALVLDDRVKVTSVFSKIVSGSGKLFVAGATDDSSPVHGDEIWQIDGSEAVLYETAPGSDFLYNRSFYATDSKFFFIGKEDATGYELYLFDPQTPTIITATTDSQTANELFSYYPNPAADQLTLSYKGTDQIASVQLRDISGKTIRSFANENMLNLEGIESGIYFLEVELKNSKQILKVIKK